MRMTLCTWKCEKEFIYFAFSSRIIFKESNNYLNKRSNDNILGYFAVGLEFGEYHSAVPECIAGILFSTDRHGSGQQTYSENGFWSAKSNQVDYDSIWIWWSHYGNANDLQRL